LAKRAEVRLAYVIGVARPLAVAVNTYGTGIVSDEKISRTINKVFDLRPGMIIKHLGLRRPIYKKVAAYGHFGRTDLDLPWEKTNKIKELRSAVGM